MTRRSPDVTIVVVNWNTADLLENCLRSIEEHTTGRGYRTVVVDNGSRDGSPDRVREKFPAVRLIANAENRGFAAATNQGIAVADTPWVLLLNSDTELTEDTISRSIDFAEEHPDVGVLGCKVLYPDRAFQPSAFRFPGLWSIFTQSSGLSRAFPKSRIFNFERYGQTEWQEPRDCDVVMGSFMLVRREAIDRAGVLDEGYFMYGEETEWCHRIRRAGYRVVYYPRSSILHLHRGSSKGPAMRWWAHGSVQQSHIVFLLRKRGRVSAALAAAIYAAGGAARAAVVFSRGVFSGHRDEEEVRARLGIARRHLRSLLPVCTASSRSRAQSILRQAAPPG